MSKLPTIKGEELLAEWVYAKERGMTQIEHARSLGISFSIYATRLQRARAAQRDKRLDNCEPFEVDLGTPWELVGDWTIVGDVQVPTTDYDFAGLPAIVAKRTMKKPRKLLIAGDLYNMDTCSHYVPVVQLPTWHDEQRAAQQLLVEWMQTFDEIRIIMGNHDRRLQKFLAGAFDENDILALTMRDVAYSNKVFWSVFGWCTIKTPTGIWRVTHPKNYSQIQLSVAEQLAFKYDQNIIAHHEHHLAIGMDRYKRHIIVNNGGLFAPEKMAYVRLDDSRSAGMSKGFCTLRNGHVYLYGPEPFTDWEEVLK